MLRAHPVSLNTISYDAVIRILKRIEGESPVAPQVTDVFVDTVGDPSFYKQRLVSAMGQDFANFIIEKVGVAEHCTFEY
jgi:hypothetical protein